MMRLKIQINNLKQKNILNDGTKKKTKNIKNKMRDKMVNKKILPC